VKTALLFVVHPQNAPDSPPDTPIGQFDRNLR
jgi:hypothetical protein